MCDYEGKTWSDFRVYTSAKAIEIENYRLLTKNSVRKGYLICSAKVQELDHRS